MANYRKSLSQPWFELVRNGKKKYEGRILKDDWLKMKPKDNIVFYDGKEEYKVVVKDIKKFKSFREAIESVGLDKVLPTQINNSIETAIENVYYKIPGYKENEELGVGLFEFYIPFLERIPKSLIYNIENDEVIVSSGLGSKTINIINLANKENTKNNQEFDFRYFVTVDENLVIMSVSNKTILYNIRKREIIWTVNEIGDHYIVLDDLRIFCYTKYASKIIDIKSGETTIIEQYKRNCYYIHYYKYFNNSKILLRINCNENPHDIEGTNSRIELFNLVTKETKLIKELDNNTKIYQCFPLKYHNKLLLRISFVLFLFDLDSLEMIKVFPFRYAVSHIMEISKDKILLESCSQIYEVNKWKLGNKTFQGNLLDLTSIGKYGVYNKTNLRIFNFNDQEISYITGFDFTVATQVPKRYDKLTPYIVNYIQESNYIPKDIANIISKLL